VTNTYGGWGLVEELGFLAKSRQGGRWRLVHDGGTALAHGAAQHLKHQYHGASMALYKQKKMTGKRSNGHAQGRGVGRGGGGWRAVDAMHITESKFERCTTAEHGGRRSVRRRGWREGWRGRYGGGGQVSRRKRQPSPRNGGYEKGAANVRRERVTHQAVAPGHSDRTDPRVERRHTVGTPHDAIGKNTARGRNPARCVTMDKAMRTYRYVSGDDGHGGREPRHSEGGRAATGRRGGRAAAIRGAPTTAASGGGATANGRRGR